MANILIKADSKYPVNRKRIRALVTDVLVTKGLKSEAIVSISIVGNRKMTKLHEDYKKEVGTTDVLSFPYSTLDKTALTPGFITPENEGLMLGDIVVSYPEARRQAREKNKMVDDQIDFLIEHGLNHLMGIHHD